ncbi:unnamed protein product, partial [Oppiella nova]
MMSSTIRRSFNALKYIHCIRFTCLSHNGLNNHRKYHDFVIKTISPNIHSMQMRYMSSDTSRSDVEWCEDVNPNKVMDSVSDTTRGTDGTTSGPDLQVLNQFNTNIMNEAKGVDSGIREFWLKHDIAVHGRDAPLPVLDMNGFSWPPAIQQALQSDGHSAPTPIQSQGWPIVLLGRDMVGVAQTGSGKTLCYVLPAFVRIAREGVQRGPKCVVLAPT